MAARGKRHPLLIYRRLFGAWRVPALLITLGCAALWWLAPVMGTTLPVRLALLAATGVAGLLFLYAAVGPRLSYVQCQPSHLLVSTPLYKLAISYRRIHTTRPVGFKPQVRWTKQWLVDPYKHLTALAVDLNGYPVSRRFLRLWLNEFVLPPDLQGVLLVVPDWMALSRDIESFRGTWKTHRKDATREKNPLTSLGSRRF